MYTTISFALVIFKKKTWEQWKPKRPENKQPFFPPIIESNGPLSTKTIRNGHFSEGMHIADKGKKWFKNLCFFLVLYCLWLKLWKSNLNVIFQSSLFTVRNYISSPYSQLTLLLFVKWISISLPSRSSLDSLFIWRLIMKSAAS